jgi:hypothetical protein
MEKKLASVVMTAALAAAPLLIVPQRMAAQSSQSAGGPGLASTVPNGTRFLVRLESKLNTRKDKSGKKFKAKTLEPLLTGTGLILPPGAEIRGHVSRVEPAGATGRARIWLTFDEIKTRDGKVPLLADVRSVPGEHSVKAGDSKEGEIEARTSAGQHEIEAAAAGAAIGAVIGATRDGKSAAKGAAIGAIGGFLIASGFGQELELQKGTKLELELTRPLYLASR